MFSRCSRFRVGYNARMALVPSHIRNDLAALQAFIAENLEYQVEGDPSLAILMAKRVMLGSQILKMARPAELSQGGYGKGSGFGQVYDNPYLEKLEKDAKAFLTSQGALVPAAGADLFGFFEGDARGFSDPLPLAACE